MSDIPKPIAKQVKAHFARQIVPNMVGMTLTLRPHNNRFVAHSEHGNLVGFVAKTQSATFQDIPAITIQHIITTSEGNLRALVSLLQ